MTCGRLAVTHRLGVLSVHGVAELQQSLELIVPGEGDDLQHGAELTEDLKQDGPIRTQTAAPSHVTTVTAQVSDLLQDLQGHRVE